MNSIEKEIYPFDLTPDPKVLITKTSHTEKVC